jgi:hypothetical protein
MRRTAVWPWCHLFPALSRPARSLLSCRRGGNGLASSGTTPSGVCSDEDETVREYDVTQDGPVGGLNLHFGGK